MLVVNEPIALPRTFESVSLRLDRWMQHGWDAQEGPEIQMTADEEDGWSGILPLTPTVTLMFNVYLHEERWMVMAREVVDESSIAPDLRHMLDM